jgi:hypothetical protein
MSQYNVLILDILHLVYRGVRPKDLVKDQARVSLLAQEEKHQWLNVRLQWISWQLYSRERGNKRRFRQRTCRLGIPDSEQPFKSRLSVVRTQWGNVQ